MQRKSLIAFVIIQAILISALIVIATNENDIALNEQNTAQCVNDCDDCSNNCIGRCTGIDSDYESGDACCTQSRSKLKNNGANCDESCSGSGSCGQDQQNSGTCRVSIGCSGRCSD